MRGEEIQKQIFFLKFSNKNETLLWELLLIIKYSLFDGKVTISDGKETSWNKMD